MYLTLQRTETPIPGPHHFTPRWSLPFLPGPNVAGYKKARTPTKDTTLRYFNQKSFLLFKAAEESTGVRMGEDVKEKCRDFIQFLLFCRMNVQTLSTCCNL